jgi:L-amino acid N-acyltransferase YncA
VHVQSWLTTYTGIVPAAYLASLNESDRAGRWREIFQSAPVYVSELEGEVVGFITGGPIREAIDTYDAELYAIYLLARAQRRHIGTALLRKLAASLTSQGFKSMLVWVLEQNPAVHFYAGSGAIQVIKKEIEIGGAVLPEIAMGWPDLAVIAPASDSD